MNASQIIFPKPSVSEILDQITPFVSDDKHEQMFRLRFEERVGLARKICSAAVGGTLDATSLTALVRLNKETLNVLISLLGVSQEEFFRHVTLARLEEHKLNPNAASFSEWKMDRIISELKRDTGFADALFSLLLFGSGDAGFVGRVPAFLREKLNGARLASIGEGGIDALVRTGLKGSYDAGKGQPVVNEVKLLLQELHVQHTVGELSIPNLSRKFDAAIPAATAPDVLIEVQIA